MHENSKRNAMLTKQRKKHGKGNKLQQGGASSIMGGVQNNRKKKLGLKGKWTEPGQFRWVNGLLERVRTWYK